VGATVTEGKQFGVIESTKAVSELYSPVTGTVVKVNDALSDNPSAVNTDPYGTGWIVEVELSDPKQVDALMDATAYSNLLKGA
jgi:glycine cleavage system H protein